MNILLYLKYWKKKIKQKWLLMLFWFIFSPIFLFFLVDFFCPLPPQKSHSTLVYARDSSTILHSFLSQDQKWRLKTHLEEINPQLQKMLIFKEDKYFYWHWGVNYSAITRAFFKNIWYNKRTSGASTITMQVARMLDRKPRTYFQKIWEIFRAFQLEFYFTKNEILQMYVNNLPYGSNIEGVKSASLIFFQKKPQYLSLAEIMTLTIIPNRPNGWEFGKKNDEIVKARNKYLKKLLNKNIFPNNDISQALQEPLVVSRLNLPQKITPLALDLQKQFPQNTEIYCTLEAEYQTKIQQLVQQYAKKLNNYNIHNACALVMDNHTHEALAYISSADFEDKKHKGEVNGIKAIRSPGSTLKPFLYGLAIDKGKITPKTILEDVPTTFNDFLPENFDKKFRGKITAELALVQSLNIPAVQLLDNIGTKNLVSLLKNLHFGQVEKDEKKLGLSLALGGCGVSLEELVNGYSIFANNGNFEKLNYIFVNKKENQNKILKKEVNKNIISSSACYLISEILSQNKRPDMPQHLLDRLDLPKIAWKTGTSLGRRDAWAIGYTSDYTIGVWVGNFTGEGINNLVGAEVATPLLMDIFSEIITQKPPNPRRGNKSQNAQNKDNSPFGGGAVSNTIKVRYVCQESGNLVNDFCENQQIDMYIPGISNPKKCEHLKQMLVSLDEKMVFCQKCVPNKKNYKKIFYNNISPALRTFYQEEKTKYPLPPPHNPLCQAVKTEGFSPRIISPLQGQSYIIPEQNSPKIALTCQVADDVREVHWFLNGVLYKTSSAFESVFFTPEFGKLNITCTDDKGRSTKIWVEIIKV